MHYFLSGLAGFLAMPILFAGPVHAGLLADIKGSRSVPETIAEVDWEEPVVDEGKSLDTVAEPKAILWESSVTLTQRTATSQDDILVTGELPVIVPAGSLFNGWRVGYRRVICSQLGENPEKRGKARFTVCFRRQASPDGSISFVEPRVRKNSKDYSKSLEGSVENANFVSGFSPDQNIKTFPWAGASIFFSYRQDGPKVALVRYPSGPRSLSVTQLQVGRRLHVKKVEGDTLLLQFRGYDLADMTLPFERRKDSGYRIEEASVDMSTDTATVDFGGGSFVLTRREDGTIRVENTKAIEKWWDIDIVNGRFLWAEDMPYVVGVQAKY